MKRELKVIFNVKFLKYRSIFTLEITLQITFKRKPSNVSTDWCSEHWPEGHAAFIAT